MTDSSEGTQTQKDSEPDRIQPDEIKPDPQEKLGHVTSDDGGGDPASDGEHPPTREVDILAISKRLQARDDWPAIEKQRNEMMKAGKARGLSKRDRQQWTYAELDRQHPPQIAHDAKFENVKPASDKGLRDQGQRVQGLQDIPAAWGALPNNASLHSEVAWVQAERLRVVHEQPGGGAAVVRLDRASVPAPSMAALGWLETSIRSYAKYVDVCAKATSTAQDEAELVRRERASIDEVRQLLGEMLGDSCPTCGRSTLPPHGDRP